MKHTKILVLCLLGVVLAVGCGKKKEKATLTVWHVGSEEEVQILNRVADDLFTPETGIRVHCEAISWTEAHSKYLTATAGGVAPDIGTMGLTWGTEFGMKGAMVDLAQAYPQELAHIKSEVFPSIWSATEFKGKVYAVPFDMTLQIVYYRKDLIPELESLLKTLNSEGKNMIIGWGSMEWIGYAPFLWQAGGDFYNKEGTAATLNTPEAERALGFFASKYNVPRAGQNFGQGLRSGDYPIGITGNWLINSFPVDAPELEGKWGIALLPAGPGGKRTAFVGGRVMGIFEQSKNKTQAWEFIKFLSREDVQRRMYDEVAKAYNVYMPPNVNAWNKLPLKKEFIDVLLKQARDAKAPPSVSGWNEATRFIVQAIQRVTIENSDPSVELSIVNDKMNQFIE